MTSYPLPLLPLDDAVVLPGMVVPVPISGAEANDDARRGIESAQAFEPRAARVVLVPRLDGRYAGVGVIATVEQIGRLPGGDRAAVLRATGRARIGAATTGPGSALWVEVTETDDIVGDDDSIPGPLLDRMELVTLDGYTEDGKVEIATTHLLPKQLKQAALEPDEVTITNEAMHLVAGEYTREAGVRQLERAIARMLRKWHPPRRSTRARCP